MSSDAAMGVAQDLRGWLFVNVGVSAHVDVHYIADPYPNHADCRITVTVRINGDAQAAEHQLRAIKDSLRYRVAADVDLVVRRGFCLRHSDCRDYPELGRACAEDGRA